MKQSTIEGWIDTFLEYGRQGLKIHPKRPETDNKQQVKANRNKMGKLVLEIDVLKKAKELLSEDESSSSE